MPLFVVLKAGGVPKLWASVVASPTAMNTESRLPVETAPEALKLSQRASIAVALGPVLVLLALTLVIGDLIAADTGLIGAVAAIGWLVFEMYAYQRLIATEDAAVAPLTDAGPLVDTH